MFYYHGLNYILSTQDLKLFMCKTREDVGQLVKAGANVNTRHGDETTPLMRHAQSGDKDLVLELLECHANVDLQDEVMYTYKK